MPRPQPKNLGTLDSFLTKARENAEVMSKHHKPAMTLIRKVDKSFRVIALGEFIPKNPIACTLAINAYFGFLAAVRVALSGQSSATFPVIRSCIESACYASQMEREPNLTTIWAYRQKSETHRKECRNAFNSAVRNTVSHLASHNSTWASFLDSVYEGSIDYGAHPNANSVLHHIEVQEVDEQHIMSFVCLQSPGSNFIDAALTACMETAIAAIVVLMYSDENNIPTPQQINLITDMQHEVAAFVKATVSE